MASLRDLSEFEAEPVSTRPTNDSLICEDLYCEEKARLSAQSSELELNSTRVGSGKEIRCIEQESKKSLIEDIYPESKSAHIENRSTPEFFTIEQLLSFGVPQDMLSAWLLLSRASQRYNNCYVLSQRLFSGFFFLY